MQKTMIIEPEGWPCKLKDCRPGFFTFKDDLFLKSEYGDNEAYCCSGESFWGGMDVDNENDRNNLMVQPVINKWVYFEGYWDKVLKVIGIKIGIKKG